MKVNAVSENRVLAMILAVMCVVIVVLAGFVIVGVNKGGEEVADEPEEIEYDVDPEVPAEEIAAYNEYTESYDEIRAKVQELLSGDAADVRAAIALYSQYINKYISDGQYNRANAFITAEIEDLTAAGFGREALDALEDIDFSGFAEPMQHRIYKEIISLAEELGDGEAVTKYSQLAADTKAAYDSNNAATDRAYAEHQERINKGGEVVQGGNK